MKCCIIKLGLNRCAGILIYGAYYNVLLQVDAAKVGLRATLLVRNNGKYLVNLDPLILCFMREAECLGRMGLELPPEAIELQFMRGKIRTNYDALTVSSVHNSLSY